MADLFEATLQLFDIIILAVIIVSAVMSLGRGLIREAFSLVAFILGGLSAFLAYRFIGPQLSAIIPPDWPDITSTIIVVVFGFLAAYSVAAFVGSRLSKLIHAAPEIGVLDRLAGAAFGVLRGVLAAVFFILLVQEVVPENAIPTWLSKAYVYDYLNAAAMWVRDLMPDFLQRVSDVIPGPPTTPAVTGPN